VDWEPYWRSQPRGPLAFRVSTWTARMVVYKVCLALSYVKPSGATFPVHILHLRLHEKDLKGKAGSSGR